MNETSTTRTIRFWWLPVLAALAIGVLTAAAAEAAPYKNHQQLSIRTRVNAFVQTCEDPKYGGTKGATASVSYGHDENGNVTSASASCSGGNFDGQVCDYTAETTDCYNPKHGNLNPVTQPIQVSTEDSALAQDPDATGQAMPTAGQMLVATEAQPAPDQIFEDDED